MIASSFLSYRYCNPTTLYQWAGTVAITGIGTLALSLAKRVAKAGVSKLTEKVNRYFESHKLQTLLQTGSHFRKNVNWVGPDGLSSLERDEFRSFLKELFHKIMPEESLILSETLEKEIDLLIDSYLANNKGLCHVISRQFGAHAKDSLKSRALAQPRASDLMASFIQQKRREGALLLQFVYLLKENGARMLLRSLPHSSVFREQLLHKADLDTASAMVQGHSYDLLTSYFPCDPKKQKTLTRKSLDLPSFRALLNDQGGSSFLLNITVNMRATNYQQEGHSLYFLCNPSQSSFLFFDSNDLCFSTNNRERFAETVFLYLRLKYEASWKPKELEQLS